MIGGGGDLLKRVDPLLSPAGTRVAGWLRPPRRARDSRTLIVRPGGMGDLILAQLAAEMLGLPETDLRWLIEGRSAGWATHLGLDFLSYDQRLPRVAMAVAGRYPRVVNTEQRFGLSMSFARWATARRGELTAFATNRSAAQADRLTSYDWADAHELDEFGRLLADAFGLTWTRPPRWDRRRDSDGTWVVALGGTHSESRSLSTDDWVALVHATAGARKVVLTAGPLEKELVTDVLSALGGRASLFQGSFSAVIERIATAERLIAIDGGPVHIASYYGVPTDVLFTAGRDLKWAPLGAGSTIRRHDDLVCRPCTVFGQVPPCPYHFACKSDIPGALRVFPVR